ncbi:MAG: vWA domain-containing protein [Clostridia bacterium]
MKKKIFISLFLILLLLTNLSFASYSTVTMSVVEEPICTIELGENSKFEKKLISKDLNNKEVTLQLQVTNGEIANKPTGEIVLVIDNSNSMTNKTASGETRGQVIRSSAKNFVTNLLSDNQKLKIGAVSFSTSNEKNADGHITVGTTEDAKILSNLTTDITTLTTAIDNITYVGETEPSYTDLQAGLNMAKRLFSTESTNKYLIVLTDGVPNVILNRNEVKYDENTISSTKSEYSSIVSSGIKPITMLTGIANGEALIETGYTYNQYIEEIFGTPENPLAGDFYYITDDEIEKTISDDILNSLIETGKSLKNITISDYFPAEIINNFDFVYVSEANIGDISATVDKTNNSITWTIPELASGETATVQYKLKLKENFDSSIVGKILNTNEKVDITYEDYDGQEQSKTSDVSPKLKLAEPPAVLPKAGITTLIITGSIIVLGILTFSTVKLFIINKKLK